MHDTRVYQFASRAGQSPEGHAKVLYAFLSKRVRVLGYQRNWVFVIFITVEAGFVTAYRSTTG
jgi:hypothetical protein